MLISFEGIDGCGKTTQVEMLRKYLHRMGHPVIAFREPGGTDIGESLRGLLKKHSGDMSATTQLFLFEAARADLVEKCIKPALEAGKIVILDRYVDSTTAYQAALHDARVGHEKIEQINAIATGGLMPSITFLLDVKRDVAKERLTARGIEDAFDAASGRFINMVHRAYAQIAKRHEDRIIVIDANRLAGNVHSDILMHIKRRLPARRGKRNG